jgi:tetratricopeptide (TPR) repeat protein
VPGDPLSPRAHPGGPPQPAEDTATLLQSISAAEAEGRIANAIAGCETLVRLSPGQREAWMRLGELQILVGKVTEAAAAFTKAARLAPPHPHPLLRLAAAQSAMGMDHQALANAHAATMLASPQPEAHLWGAFYASNLGWRDVAKREVDSLPQEVGAWWASVRERIRRDEQAARQAAKLDCDDIMGWHRDPAGALRVAAARCGAGWLREAERALEAAAAEPAAALHVARLRAAIAFRRRGPAAALTVLDAWIAAQPDPDPRLVKESARFLGELGRFEDAAERLLGLPAAHRDSEAWHLLAKMVLLRGDAGQLLEIVRDYAAALPNDTQSYRFVIAATRAAGLLPVFPGTMVAPATAAPPRRILQFWDRQPPDDVMTLIRAWRDTHPDCEHTLLDEPTSRGLIAERLGERAAEAFDRCHHPAMKSDFVRLVWLHAHGGAYIDADEVCRKSIGPILDALAHVEFIACISSDPAPYVHNLFLAARPGARVLGVAIEDMLDRLSKPDAPARPDIWQTTGPGAVTRAVGRVLLESLESEGGPHGLVALTTDLNYRTFAGTDEGLAYKKTREGNWRMA